MMGSELEELIQRQAEMHGTFEIRSVVRKRNLFFRYVEITAQDKDTGFVVVARFEGSPSEQRIVDGLKQDLDYLLRREAISKLAGKIIMY